MGVVVVRMYGWRTKTKKSTHVKEKNQIVKTKGKKKSLNHRNIVISHTNIESITKLKHFRKISTGKKERCRISASGEVRYNGEGEAEA